MPATAANVARTTPAPTSLGGTRALVVSVYGDFASVEPVWRALEADAVMTAFQQFDYLEAWASTLGAGVAPFIVVIGDGERVLALLPLCLTRLAGLRIARFMGGSHSSYGLPVFAPGAATRLTVADVAAALVEAARTGGRRVDGFVLSRQPRAWEGIGNPLHALPGTPTACNGYEFDLDARFDTVLAASDGGKRRKRMRAKERKIAAAGPAGLAAPVTFDGQVEILDAFLRQKSARMRAQGLADVFAVPGTRAFFVELLRRSVGRAEPLCDFLAYRGGGDNAILATVGLAGFRGRRLLNTASFAEHPLAAHSPGELLIFQSIEQACVAGYQRFDLGIGEERYKSAWKPRTIELRDAIVPVSLAGRLYALLLRGKLAAKRALRQNAAAWDLIKRLRGVKAAAAPKGEED